MSSNVGKIVRFCNRCGTNLPTGARFYNFKERGAFCFKCMKRNACASEARGDLRILRANGTVLCQICARDQGVKVKTSSQQVITGVKKAASETVTNFLISFGVILALIGVVGLVIFVFLFETNIATNNACAISRTCVVTNFDSAIATDVKGMYLSGIALAVGVLMLIDGLFRRGRSHK